MWIDSQNTGRLRFRLVFLSAADEGDDFEAVVRLQHALGMPAAGDEFEVAFDRDVLRFHFELHQQHGDRHAVIDVARLVVNRNLHRAAPANVTQTSGGLYNEINRRRECRTARGEPSSNANSDDRQRRPP